MNVLELKDIQGYVVRGYAHMMYSRFVYLQIIDPDAFKRWLVSAWPSFTTAKHIPEKTKIPDTHLNIGFTHGGLRRLGMYEGNLASFSREFREGMVSPHRTRILGDVEGSDPDKWRWGGPATKEVHLCLMVFGRSKDHVYYLEKDKEVCLRYYETLALEFSTHGLEEVYMVDGATQPENKEHFGFRDGISQPIIEGSGRVGSKDDVVKAGEFVYGYRNEFGVYPDPPLLTEVQGNLNLLSADAEGSGKKDFGRNGSMMVMRQLQQDVEGFWSFLNEKTKKEDGSIDPQASLKLGAKIMGRWQSGAPITLFPDKDPGVISDINDFGYAKFDSDGRKCPFGSHLRRANPRDSVDDHGVKESLKLSKQHRIIRRARLYGEIFEGSPLNRVPKGEVGLLFVCFNADIGRQFEFLQYTWGNLPKIKELYNDPDPIIGVKENPGPGEEQNFTIQDYPVNRTISGLPRFITVRGGAYFFFPSISAIRYLATI